MITEVYRIYKETNTKYNVAETAVIFSNSLFYHMYLIICVNHTYLEQTYFHLTTTF